MKCFTNIYARIVHNLDLAQKLATHFSKENPRVHARRLVSCAPLERQEEGPNVTTREQPASRGGWEMWQCTISPFLSPPVLECLRDNNFECVVNRIFW
jgi:hypothetical protein